MPLPAEGAGDEGDGHQAIEEPELAHGIGEIDLGRGGDGIALRAARHPPAGGGELAGDRRRALDMAGRDDGEKPGMAGLERAMGGGHDRLLARMGAGGEPGLAARESPAQLGEGGLIGGQRIGGEFQIAQALRVSRPQAREARGLGRVLGQHHAEAREQRPDERAGQRPARLGAGGEASVHQPQGNASPVRLAQEIGPELGFDPEREIRAPVIEEARDPGLAVQRQILMQRPRRPAPGHEPRRGHRAAGDEQVQIGLARGQRGDQGQQRLGLPHAGAMQPAEAPGRPGQARLAIALADPLGLFLALGHAPGEMAAQQRCREPGGAAVEGADHAAAVISCLSRWPRGQAPSRHPPRRIAGRRDGHRRRRGRSARHGGRARRCGHAP